MMPRKIFSQTVVGLFGATAFYLALALTPKAALAATGCCPDFGPATCFPITSSGDAADFSPGDGQCDSDPDTVSLPVCTLRAALQEANTIPENPDAFEGNLVIICNQLAGSSNVIATTDPLPPIQRSLTIRGRTALFIGEIILQGPGTGSGVDGFTVQNGSSQISGWNLRNYQVGILLAGGIHNGINGNVLESNQIGLKITASEHFVGTPGDSNRNFIGNNSQAGIRIEGQQTGNNVIQNNLIGTTPDGSPPWDDRHGIQLEDAPANFIGGLNAAARNVISGNQQDGVHISGGAASNNRVQGNYIGLNAAGSVKLGNQGNGVHLTRPSNAPSGPDINVIGGPEAGARNVISGNTKDGVRVDGEGVNDNTIQGNFIGTDPAGSVALGNGGSGIQITNTPELPQDEPNGAPINHLIGGEDPAALDGPCTGVCNLVSGNVEDGIRVTGPGVTGHHIYGNFVGTDVSGKNKLGNTGNGIFIGGSYRIAVGGLPQALNQPNPKRNLISGNGKFGVALYGALAKLNEIQGNLVGSDLTGAQLLGNEQGGVKLEFTSGNTVGGNLKGTGNIIVGNLGPGILLDQAQENLIHGNLIGTDAAGTALSNQGHGIHIRNTSNGNKIGGAIPGVGNSIAHNSGSGIFVESLLSNAILGNAIFSNAKLGIDLAPEGPSENDAEDFDPGANELQNYPVLQEAAPHEDGLVINGKLSSVPDSMFTLEFFSNAECDAGGFGEGQNFLGSAQVTTDGTGEGIFSIPMPVGDGAFISATATDSGNNTSEFSRCLEVGALLAAPGLDAAPSDAGNCPNCVATFIAGGGCFNQLAAPGSFPAFTWIGLLVLPLFLRLFFRKR